MEGEVGPGTVAAEVQQALERGLPEGVAPVLEAAEEPRLAARRGGPPEEAVGVGPDGAAGGLPLGGEVLEHRREARRGVVERPVGPRHREVEEGELQDRAAERYKKEKGMMKTGAEAPMKKK